MRTENHTGEEQLGPIDRTTEVIVDPEPLIVTDPVVAEPVVVPGDRDTVAGSTVVAESQVAVVDPDGAVSTTYERVEEQTVVTRDRRNWLWPLLGLLALLLALGLLAWWYFSGDDSKQVPNVVGSSLTTAVNRLATGGLQELDHPQHASRARRHRLCAIAVCRHRREEGLRRPDRGVERAWPDRGPVGGRPLRRSGQAVARRRRPPGDGGTRLLEPGRRHGDRPEPAGRRKGRVG